MVNETREDLDKATSDLIASFIKFDQIQAKHLEIGLHTLHNAQKNKKKKINLYTVCDHDMLHQLLAEHGILRQEFDKIPQLLESPQQQASAELPPTLKQALLSKPDYNVPNAAMVAVMFNMVNDKVKNALIAGRAGERTLKAIDRATTVSHFPLLKELAFKDTLYDYKDNTKLARENIDNGVADYLVSAKATEHLADLLETSLKLYPPALNFSSTLLSLNSFSQLAANIFHLSSQSLRQHNATDAADKIQKLAKYIENSTNNATNLPAHEEIANAMRIIRQSMQEDGIITAKESDDYNKLVEKRIEQIKKISVLVD